MTNRELELFGKISVLLHGVELDTVANIAMNLLVNAIISDPSIDRKRAEFVMNELFGRAKTKLLDQCYDSVTGKRRTVIPTSHVIEMPFHTEEDTFFPTKQ